MQTLYEARPMLNIIARHASPQSCWDLCDRYADVVVHRQLLAALAGAAVPPQPHADLAAAAHTMNVRHRQAKAAQKECSELFLLLLLHAKPHVERALVGGTGLCQHSTPTPSHQLPRSRWVYGVHS